MTGISHHHHHSTSQQYQMQHHSAFQAQHNLKKQQAATACGQPSGEHAPAEINTGNWRYSAGTA